jgi:hypothetical protein
LSPRPRPLTTLVLLVGATLVISLSAPVATAQVPGTSNGHPGPPGPPGQSVLGVSVRSHCNLFKQNFGGPQRTSAFNRCGGATLRAIAGTSPSVACDQEKLSHRRRRGERRSDYAACVLAVTQTVMEMQQGF